jgi:hypothetical protein
VAARGEGACPRRSRAAPQDGGPEDGGEEGGVQEEGTGAREDEGAAEEVGQRRVIRPSPTNTLAPPTLTSVIASGGPAIRMCTRLGLSIFTP